MLIHFVLTCLYFMWPGGMGNMIPIPVARYKIFEFLNVPIDFGAKLRGKRIFGDHKTFRGFFFGIVIGACIGALQSYLYRYEFFRDISLFDYSNVKLAALLGAMQGLGALVGDSVESFFKRQVDVKPGQSWFPFDQIDYIIGAFFFSLPFVDLSWGFFIAIVFLYAILHIISHAIGYLLGMNEHWI